MAEFTHYLNCNFQARLDKNNLENMIKKAIQTSAKFNAELNRERKEERRAYFDLQTNVSTVRFSSRVTSLCPFKAWHHVKDDDDFDGQNGPGTKLLLP